MSLLVVELELRSALARRRLFFLNVAVPLLLVTPIALGAAPAFHAAAVYTVLFVLSGTFGSAIPLVRDAEAGLLERVLRSGLSPAVYLLQRAIAGSLLDALQLAPALAVAGLAGGASAVGLTKVWLALAVSLWIANLIGVAVAAAARSLAETALFSAVTALLLLHVSGVFRTPAQGSVWAGAESASPFRALHEATLAMATASPAQGGTALVLWALVLPSVIALFARQLTQTLRVVRSA